MHQDLWTLNRSNIPLIYRLSGRDWSCERIEEAINDVVSRHKVLRTAFQWDADNCWQVVHDVARVNIDIYDMRYKKRADIQAVIDDCILHYFDYKKPPLIQAIWLRMSDKKFILAISLHHLIADVYTSVLFAQEMFAEYKGDLLKKDGLLPKEPSYQFIDHVLDQNKQLDALSSRHQGYWQAYLEGHQPMRLAGYKDYVSKESSSQCIYVFNALEHDVEHLSASLVMLAWIISYYLSTGQLQALFCMPVSERRRGVSDTALGFISGPMPVHFKLEPTESVRSHLKRIKSEQMASLRRYVPIGALGLPVTYGVLLNFLDERHYRSSFGSGIDSVLNAYCTPNVMGLDLFVFCVKSTNHLDLYVHYQPEHYARDVVENFANLFIGVLADLRAGALDVPLKEWVNQCLYKKPLLREL